jgi:hypothetical protein
VINTKRTIVALLVLATGCAGPSPKPAERPPIHACDLLTLDEADPQGKDLLSPVGNAVDESVGAESAKCAYGTADLPVRVVSLEVRRFRDPAAARSAQRAARGMLRGLAGEEARPVESIGDDAAWAGGRLCQLHVQSGDLRLIVSIEVGEEAQREARARAIATQALARLAAPPAKPAS